MHSGWIIQGLCWLISCGLFRIGDFVFKKLLMPLQNYQLAYDIFYPIYNRLMMWSMNMQYFAGLKSPWKLLDEI